MKVGENPAAKLASEYQMIEIYETSLTADHWSDPEGNRLSIGELKVEEDEVLDPELLTEVKPREEFEGYTGNYLYHCHVLEHEANDMMRPFEVIA